MAGLSRRLRWALAACALAGGGCLESKPAPAGGFVQDAGAVPTDSGVPGDDAAIDPSLPDAAPVTNDGGAAAWAGSWLFVSGASGVTCGSSFSIEAVEGLLSITQATAANQLIVVEDGCTFRFTIAGDTATQTPAGQPCSKWAIPAIPEWTLTMGADGMLAEKIGGRVALNGESCMISGTARLQRQ